MFLLVLCKAHSTPPPLIKNLAALIKAIARKSTLKPPSTKGRGLFLQNLLYTFRTFHCIQMAKINCGKNIIMDSATSIILSCVITAVVVTVICVPTTYFLHPDNSFVSHSTHKYTGVMYYMLLMTRA